MKQLILEKLIKELVSKKGLFYDKKDLEKDLRE